MCFAASEIAFLASTSDKIVLVLSFIGYIFIPKFYMSHNIMNRKEWELVYKEKCSDIKKYPSVLPPVERIIVIGDLHGDWEMTIKSLKIARLINDKHNWIGKERTGRPRVTIAGI